MTLREVADRLHVLRHRGAYDEAKELLEGWMAAHPAQRNHLWALSALGTMAYHEGLLDEAVSACRRKLSLDPLDQWAHGVLAFVYRLRGDLSGARRELETFLEIEASTSAAGVGSFGTRTELASVLLASGHPGEAEAMCMVDFDPGAVDPKRDYREIVQRLRVIARVCEAKGDYTGAAEALRRATRDLSGRNVFILDYDLLLVPLVEALSKRGQPAEETKTMPWRPGEIDIPG